MNALADKFAGQKVGSIFLYTHEAHPGENYPHLTSMDQKFKHAEALRDVLGVSRPILVDALDGACHPQSGLGGSGRIYFFWAGAGTLEPGVGVGT